LRPAAWPSAFTGKTEAVEQFACNYGLNPAYRDQISRGELKISGTGPEGEVRVVEISAQRFFIATLFLPQLSQRRRALTHCYWPT